MPETLVSWMDQMDQLGTTFFIPVGEPWSPYASCHTYIQIHTATVQLYVPKSMEVQ